MQPPWHPVVLLLNPPKSSQSNVSYGSYESGELRKQKPLQEALMRFKVVIARAKEEALKEKAEMAKPRLKASSKLEPRAPWKKRKLTPKAM